MIIPETGKPPKEGRYVAFVRCEAMAAKAWVEPIIVTWCGGRWQSSLIAQRRVLGWIGPLPVLKVDDLDFPPAFDL